MKNIFVPTDFSACAGFALDAAAQLAHRFGSKLYLFTNLDLPIGWSKKTEAQKEEYPEALKQIENAKTLFLKIKEDYADIAIETAMGNGKMVELINQYTIDHGTDLIVMGSHGTSGKSEYFIGSNTQKVVRGVHCPVLVIKQPVEDINFDKVVYASHFHESDQPAFLKFKAFVKHFIPEIHLVEIHTASIFDPPVFLSKETMEKFSALCAPFKCHTHIYRDFSIEKGIRSFSEEIGAKLIGISNRQRHPLKRMLVGSNVEALVNHADVPVLSIDYKE
jgi:nucleotide-binding universal stress UspA family protein